MKLNWMTIIVAFLFGIILSSFLRNMIKIKKGIEPEDNIFGRIIEKFNKEKVEEIKKKKSKEKSVTRIKSKRKKKRKK